MYLQYSTKKNFKSGSKSVTISKKKTVSTKIEKMKAKKKYYIRVRTFKSVGGVKFFSDWSEAKAIRTK